jgi:hypothetical protein
MNEYEPTFDDEAAIRTMPDVSPWTSCSCPCCGGPAETRISGLRAVARTGDENMALREYRWTSYGATLGSEA